MNARLEKWSFLLLRLAGWVAVAAIAVLSLVPGEARPHTIESGQVEHLIAYAGTSLLLALGYLWRVRAVAIGAALTGYAAILEAMQILIPGRGPRLVDFAMSSLGVWLAIALVGLWLWRRNTRSSLSPPAHGS